jgi:hypothetical protein
MARDPAASPAIHRKGELEQTCRQLRARPVILIASQLTGLRLLEIGREEIRDGLGSEASVGPHEIGKSPLNLDTGQIRPVCEGAHEHHAGDPLGPSLRVGDGRRSAARKAQQRHLIEAQVLDQRIQLRDLAIE